jgi:hypothetical protein
VGSQLNDRPADQASGFDWRSALLFVAGALLMVRVRLVGDIYGSDLLLLIGTMVGLGTLRTKIPKVAYTTLVMVILWLLGAMLTDTIRGTLPSDYLRTWGRIVFFTNSMIAVALLSEFRLRRITWYLLGVAIGGLGLAILSPNAYASVFFWKFGFGGPSTLLIVCLVSLWTGRRGLLLATVAVIAIGVFSFVQGARSLGAISILTALSFLLLTTLHRRAERRGSGTALAILLVVAGSGYGIFEVYGRYAEQGALGRDAKAKFESQSGTDLGFVLAGRSESIISIRAIRDRPIIGHGSWARNRDYAMQYRLLLRQHGIKEIGGWDRLDAIPTHSHLFGAWVESGILGGAFWIWCLFLIGRALNAVVRNEAPYSPIVLFALLNLTWNILFSPFGSVEKSAVAGQLILFIATIFVPMGAAAKVAHRQDSRGPRSLPRAWRAPSRQAS